MFYSRNILIGLVGLLAMVLMSTVSARNLERVTVEQYIKCKRCVVRQLEELPENHTQNGYFQICTTQAHLNTCPSLTLEDCWVQHQAELEAQFNACAEQYQ